MIRPLVAALAMIAASAQLEAQSRYVLVSNLTHKVLTVDAATTNPTENVHQADYNAGRNQHWIVSRPAFDGTVQIRNVATGRVLEQVDTASGPAPKVRRLVSGRSQQQWRVASLGDDAAEIASAHSGLELTVYPWTGLEVAPIILASSWGSEMYGKWLLVPADSTPPAATLDWSLSRVGQVSARGNRNALRVLFKLSSAPNGQGNVVWLEGLYLASSDNWVSVGTLPVYRGDGPLIWPVEAYALGVDNSWHRIGTTTVVAPPLPPPGDVQPPLRGK